MAEEPHYVVRDRLVAAYPDLREEYERLRPSYKAIASRLRASRGEEPPTNATR